LRRTKRINWRDVKTNEDRWRWYAQYYASERLFRDKPLHEQTASTDPDGDWFNPQLVDEATIAYCRDFPNHPNSARILAQLGIPVAEPKPFTFTDKELEERREWARLKGYENWNAFLDAIQAGAESIQPFLAWSLERRKAQGPPRSGTFMRLGSVMSHPPAAKEEVDHAIGEQEQRTRRA
jgi:hypothetical protein